MALVLVSETDPVLHQPAAQVTDFTRLPALVGEMLEVMYAAGGIGLAAPQVGVGLAVAVIDLQTGGRRARYPYVLVNPRLSSKSGQLIHGEGCLSLPGRAFQVPRAVRLTVAALDGAGRPWKMRAGGLLAACIQHEMDHLAGILIADRVVS
jgi:peptide deformylase